MYLSFFKRGHNRALILFMICLFMPSFLFAQLYRRIEADFSIKEKIDTNKKRLTMGRVYYDINEQKIVYRIDFPSPKTVVITDSIIYQIKNNKILSRSAAHNIESFSIFHLSLKGNLPYYGLKDSPYNLVNVEKTDSMVVSTWKLPKKLVTKQGKIMLAQKDRLLHGLVTFDKKGNILSKQLFENYTKIRELTFPKKVVQFLHKKNGVQIKLVTYQNIKINSQGHEDLYDYTIPVN